MPTKFVNQERDYSIDLLRIISMFMIVSLHSVSHGVSDKLYGVNLCNIWFHFESSVCLLAVNIYVLISGFFLVKERFRLSKLYKVIIETFFYSWVILSLLIIFRGPDIGNRTMISALLPLSYNQYWFISAYAGMYILSPIVNLLIHSITQKQHIGIIIVLSAYFSLWNSIIPYSQPMGIHRFGQSVMWFMVLYLISAYLRLYLDKPTKNRTVGLVFGVSIAFMILSWLLLVLVGERLGITLSSSITEYFFHYNSFPVLLASVSLFMWFRSVRIKYSYIKSIIRFVGPLCLGVYLIHDNPNIRDVVWKGLNSVQCNCYWLPFIAAGYALVVFLICLIIDYFRSLLFSLVNRRRWYRSVYSKMDNYLYVLYDNLTNRIIKRRVL